MLKHAREINSRRFIHDFAWLSIEKIVLEKFWEKITDTCAFFMVVWCQTHYQTLSTRKNWLLCVQNTLLAFCHTGPTKRIEKKSGRIEKAGRIKIYTGNAECILTSIPTGTKITKRKGFSHIKKKKHLLLVSKITSYWLLVKKRIYLLQIAQIEMHK